MVTAYSLFGLTLRSDVPLPCRPARDSQSRAAIDLAESTRRELEALCLGAPTRVEEDGFWSCALYENGAAAVGWKDHFDFVVSPDGSAVRWRRRADVPDDVLLTYLLGQVLSFCLVARGLEPLHATSVVVNGSAIAFLGDSGAGKSTLAAALVDRGCRLVTDDVLTVTFEDDRAIAWPSLPRLKLTPESADAVFRGRRALPMNRFTSKMIFRLGDDQHADRQVPLRALYVVTSDADGAGDVVVRDLTGRAALLSIVRHTFNDSVMHASRVRRQFEFARRLAGRVSIHTLSCPRQLRRLPAVVDRLLAGAEGSDLP